MAAADPFTVICHFRNEEVYLPYWLRHHARLFDHGVMIDYASSDRSREIIRELAPHWEIRPSRNAVFHSVSIDAEVMDIEKELTGWKMCLNVTEFVMHPNLKGFVAELERVRPDAPGLVTTGFIIQDSPEQLGVALTETDLWEQRHFGCPEPDPYHGVIDRGRLLHRALHGAYGTGRHNNGVSRITDPPLYLFWYGWCPLALKKLRNRSTVPMMPACDGGGHHRLADERVDEIWQTRYLPRCGDLLDGRWPLLNEAVAAMRALGRSRVKN
jgi:Glycosyl transferase family 2